ncbi:hypothetical protein PTTG_26280 [Puccinia triticina 1-1 BBBD Race 1]|uniref:Uncharacterized protein n=2 Tax=Puccinia triticina TaxID=208348 RepID=A0A180GW76_PUCT1|nr:hypothetical protein PTTG_26280 [Puccinia triticina 1-1 BBBD Race 1]
MEEVKAVQEAREALQGVQDEAKLGGRVGTGETAEDLFHTAPIDSRHRSFKEGDPHLSEELAADSAGGSLSYEPALEWHKGAASSKQDPIEARSDKAKVQSRDAPEVSAHVSNGLPPRYPSKSPSGAPELRSTGLRDAAKNYFTGTATLAKQKISSKAVGARNFRQNVVASLDRKTGRIAEKIKSTRAGHPKQ